MDDQNNKNQNEDIFAEGVDREAAQEQQRQQESQNRQENQIHQGSGDTWTQSHIGRENWNGQNRDNYQGNGEWNQQQWNQGEPGSGYAPYGQNGYGAQGQNQGDYGSNGYYSNGYGPNGYQPYQQPPRTVNNYCGIAALVLGILSLLCFCTFINLLPAVLAIVFGILQLHQEKKAQESGLPVKSGRGFAWAGIICSIISIVLLFATVAVIITNQEFRDTFEREYHKQQQRQIENYGDDIYNDYFNDNDL